MIWENIKKGLGKVKESIDQKIEDNRIKKEFLNSLTNNELEKTYKAYVSKSLKKEIHDISTNKTKKVDMTRKDIVNILFRQVDIDVMKRYLKK